MNYVYGRMGSFGYDAENRMVTATVSGVPSSYAYDGDGRRVQATVGSSTPQVFIYSASGELMAETASTGAGQRYLTVDGLGSTRMVTDAAGNVTSRHDYEPFGEELISTTNPAVRTTANGYAGPEIGVRQAFTGKERDAETGLDFFESRYYSSAQGRFTSPDEFKGGFLDAFSGQAAFQPGPLPYADLNDPQTLNKYAYVRNNPLRYTDPNGHCIFAIVDTIACGEAVLVAGTAAAAGAAYLMTPQGKESARVFFTGIAAGVGWLMNKFSQADDKPAPVVGSLPSNPDALKDDGYQDTSHPDAAAAGHRTLENPQTGDKVRFDKGKPGAQGHEGSDHYHRYNPKATGKRDQYLDASGKPVPRGSDASHLKPKRLPSLKPEQEKEK